MHVIHLPGYLNLTAGDPNEFCFCLVQFLDPLYRSVHLRSLHYSFSSNFFKNKLKRKCGMV